MPANETQPPEAHPAIHCATLIDRHADARSFRSTERKSVTTWLTHQLRERHGGRRPLAATITSPAETPMVLIAHDGPVGRISDCLDASESRWLNRRPWQTFVMRHDGAVESYYTPSSCEARNDDAATARLDIQSAIYPDNPQILLIDIGDERDLLTILGPGSANMMDADDWLETMSGGRDRRLMN